MPLPHPHARYSQFGTVQGHLCTQAAAIGLITEDTALPQGISQVDVMQIQALAHPEDLAEDVTLQLLIIFLGQ